MKSTRARMLSVGGAGIPLMDTAEMSDGIDVPLYRDIVIRNIFCGGHLITSDDLMGDPNGTWVGCSIRFLDGDWAGRVRRIHRSTDTGAVSLLSPIAACLQDYINTSMYQWPPGTLGKLGGIVMVELTPWQRIKVIINQSRTRLALWIAPWLEDDESIE